MPCAGLVGQILLSKNENHFNSVVKLGRRRDCHKTWEMRVPEASGSYMRLKIFAVTFPLEPEVLLVLRMGGQIDGCLSICICRYNICSQRELGELRESLERAWGGCVSRLRSLESS